MSETRVMMLLLDGAPFDVFHSLAEKGVLPNMQKLMKKGCFNVLNSTIPPISPVAIPSLLTGRNPGKHGMFGFGYMENKIFRPYTSRSIVGETIWDMSAAANTKVILLNVPWTFPPFKVNGVMITGFPSPSNKAESYPSEILSILESKIGRYYVDLNLKGLNFRGADEQSFLEEAYLITMRRVQAMHYLMENYEWDLFLTVFTTLDRMQHVFFGYFDEESPLFDAEKRKVLVEYYKEIDSIVGKTISLLDENTILFVVSDHGFDYLSKYVGLNNVLIQGGFARETSKFRIFTVERIVSFLEKIGLKDGYGLRVPHTDRIVSPRTTNIVTTIFPTRLDYSRSECYAQTGGTLSINKNTVENSEVFKRRLTEFLYSVTDGANGDKIVEKVYDKNEIYHGNRVGDASDLILVFKEGYEPHLWTKEAIEPVKLVSNKTVKTGTHTSSSSRRGIFIVSGPGIKKGFHFEANIVDIAPTILHVLGLPVSPDMDGQVLKRIFKSKSGFETRQVKFQEFDAKEKKYRSSKEDEEAIKKRLRQLGYI